MGLRLAKRVIMLSPNVKDLLMVRVRVARMPYSGLKESSGLYAQASAVLIIRKERITACMSDTCQMGIRWVSNGCGHQGPILL